jgi:hypothetical protein
MGDTAQANAVEQVEASERVWRIEINKQETHQAMRVLQRWCRRATMEFKSSIKEISPIHGRPHLTLPLTRKALNHGDRADGLCWEFTENSFRLRVRRGGIRSEEIKPAAPGHISEVRLNGGARACLGMEFVE